MPHDDDFTCRCPHTPFDDAVAAAVRNWFSRRAFLTGLGAAAATAFVPRPARAAGTTTIYKAARLFDGERVLTPGVLVVRNDRIVGTSAGDAGSDATVIDLGDATIVPGLIDAHTHSADRVVVSRLLTRPRSEDTVAGAALGSVANVRAMLRNGFTTVRDVGGSSGIDIALRDAIAAGKISGPRMLVAGPSLSITGGHGDANDLAADVNVNRPFDLAVGYGPYAFRELVREHVKRHVDLIKILATGGVLSYGDAFDVPQLNPDEIAAIVDEAHKFGLKVAAHCHGDRGIAEAVRGGVASIEHGTGVGDKTLAAMKQRGTALVPTLWALDSILQPGNPFGFNEGQIAKARQAAQLRDEGMKRAVASGVRIVYGTDAGVFPHQQNNKDFALMANFGMSPTDVLKSATSHAADLLGASDRGRLKAGLLADVAVFPGDATRDVRLLEKPPALVLFGGAKVS